MAPLSEVARVTCTGTDTGIKNDQIIFQFNVPPASGPYNPSTANLYTWQVGGEEAPLLSLDPMVPPMRSEEGPKAGDAMWTGGSDTNPHMARTLLHKDGYVPIGTMVLRRVAGKYMAKITILRDPSWWYPVHLTTTNWVAED